MRGPGRCSHARGTCARDCSRGPAYLLGGDELDAAVFLVPWLRDSCASASVKTCERDLPPPP